MAAQLSCLLVRRSFAVRNCAPLVSNARFPTPARRFLCSASNKSKEPEQEQKKPATEEDEKSISGSQPATTESEAGIVEATRNVVPANADEYTSLESSDDIPADVAATGTAFSQSLAYRMEVAEAIGRTEKQARSNRVRMRVRYVLHSTIIITIIYLCFFLPGSEEIDDLTGDVYRRPPGYVDAINDFRRLRAYLRGDKRPPERYVWP